MTGRIQLFFSLSFSPILSYVFFYTACFSTLFSFTPDNLVSRDEFGSPVPRQFFFSLLLSTKFEHRLSRALHSGLKYAFAAVLCLLYHRICTVKTIYRFSTCACWQSKLSGEMHGRRYIKRVIRFWAARLLYQCNAPVRTIRARYLVLRCQNQSNFLNWETVSTSMPVVNLLSL